MKTALLTGAGAFVVLGAMAWFLGMLPNLQTDVQLEDDSLASGISLFEQRNYEAALEVLQSVPSGAAQEAKARYYQGSAHMMLKDFESAVDYLEQSLALNSSDSGTLYALGVAYFKLGNTKLAKGYFAAVLEIEPNNAQAKGLMDIMAKLERQSVAESEGDESPDKQ